MTRSLKGLFFCPLFRKLSTCKSEAELIAKKCPEFQPFWKFGRAPMRANCRICIHSEKSEQMGRST